MLDYYTRPWPQDSRHASSIDGVTSSWQLLSCFFQLHHLRLGHGKTWQNDAKCIVTNLLNGSSLKQCFRAPSCPSTPLLVVFSTALTSLRCLATPGQRDISGHKWYGKKRSSPGLLVAILPITYNKSWTYVDDAEGSLNQKAAIYLLLLCSIQTDSTVSIDPRTQQSYEQLAYVEGEQTWQ